jgi:hypothetical protein
VIVIHAGNRADAPGRSEPRFPAESRDRVTTSTARLLKALKPTLVVSAPASGADLIVLGEARKLRIPVHVLPLPAQDFLDASVADGGPEWVDRYRRLLSAADRNERDTVERRDLSSVADWWLAANEWIVKVGAKAARQPTGSVEPVLALTIRPIGVSGPASVTDHLADLAAARGWPVLTIDPRPNDPETISVS